MAGIDPLRTCPLVRHNGDVTFFRSPLFALMVVLGASGCAHRPARPAFDASAVESTIKSAIAEQSVPGASVAIAGPEGITFSRAFGLRSIETKERVSRRTTFRIGSISKFVTAVAVMRFVEQGRIRLDAPIASALPGRAQVSHLPSSVTVATLLNHTSGIAEHTETELISLVEQGVTDANFSEVLHRPLLHQPGAGWSYTNVPYRVLSWLVEHASGKPFNRYIAEDLAPGLGLETLHSCDQHRSEQAVGYLSEKGKLRPEAAYAIRGLLGEGGLCASAADIAQLPHALLSGRWISATSVETMVRPTELTTGVRADYGLGVRRGILGSEPLWGHTGSGLHGGWAAVAYYPARRTTVVVLANGSGGPDDAVTLQGKIAAALFKQPGPADLPVEASVARAVAGTYTRGKTVCVFESSGGIFRKQEGSEKPKVRLLHQGQGIFGRADYPLDRHAFQIAGGKAIGHAVHYDGFFAELWTRARRKTCSP